MQGVSYVDINMLDKIESLHRNVFKYNDKICLETDTIEGVKYAFYLENSNSIKKRFYSNDSMSIFDMPFDKGIYQATFFYQFDGRRHAVSQYFSINNVGDVTFFVKNTVAEEEKWKLDFYDAKSETTFIVFNAAGSKLSDKPFGLDYLLLKGYNVIAFLQDNNHYQELSFERMKELVTPLIDGHEVFLYGSSVGGYCAIYYAGAVNGTVISAAPRNPCDPDLIKNWNEEFGSNKIIYKHSKLINNPLTSKNVYIIYDPFVEIDVYFIDSFVCPAYSNVKLIESDYAGHQVLYHLKQTKQLPSILEAIVEGRDKDIAIDNELESCFTDAGKAQYFFDKKDYDNSIIFSKKSLAEGEGILTKAHKLEVEKIYKQALKQREVKSMSNIGFFSDYRFK